MDITEIIELLKRSRKFTSEFVEKLTTTINVLCQKYGEDEAKKLFKQNKKSLTTTGNISRLDFLKTRFKNEDLKAIIEDSGENKEDNEKMPGSITLRKDGRYMGKVYFLSKPYYVYSINKTECEKKLRLKWKELKDNAKDNVISKSMSLNIFYDYWMNTFKKQILKTSTFIKYNEIYNRYVVNDIGKKKIQTFKSNELQSFINKITSQSAKQKILTMLKEMFDILHKENYIKFNPMNLVLLPKKNADDLPIIVEKRNKIINYYDELYFLNYLAKRKIVATEAVEFILYSGLRRGECVGLLWDNIDFVNNEINVTQQWNVDVGKITSLKTSASFRTLPLFPQARKVLEKLAINKKNEFVFSGIKRITQIVASHAKKLNLDITVHNLRHTFASRLYACGVDASIIQKWLGHTSLSTTLDIYTHVVEAQDKDVINDMKKFLKELNVIERFDN